MATLASDRADLRDAMASFGRRDDRRAVGGYIVETVAQRVLLESSTFVWFSAGRSYGSKSGIRALA
jgi:hypothetical protein